MDSDKVKKWITLGANLGVLIGIFLLIVELQQNREMMRAQTRADIAAVAIDHFHVVAMDQELADILRRARFGEELGGTESTRYLFYTLATFRAFENVHYQYRLGLFDESEFAGELKSFQQLVTGSVGLTKNWCQFRVVTSKEFRIQVDAVFDDLNCDEQAIGTQID
jgi:hypothetical protein